MAASLTRRGLLTSAGAAITTAWLVVRQGAHGAAAPAWTDTESASPPTTTASDSTIEGAMPPPASAAYPLTLEQTGGTITIDAPPERVVVLGDWALEMALALGVTPVAWVKYDGEAPPWLADRAELVEIAQIERTAELPIETVLAARPDLVVDINGTDSGLYDSGADARSQLGDIPLVSPPTGTEDSWDERLIHLATALDRRAAAIDLIDATRQRLEQALAESPELAGAAVTFGRIDPGPVVTLLVNNEDFTRRFLDEELGFTTPSAQATLDDTAYPGAADISLERFDLIEADVALILFGAPELEAEIESNELWQQLDVVERGAVVEMSLPDAIALRTPGPLSIDYLIDDVLPRIVTVLAE